MADLQIIKSKLNVLIFFMLLFSISVTGAFAENTDENLSETEKKIIEIEQRIKELNDSKEKKEEKKAEKDLIKEKDYIKLVSAAGRDYSLRAPGVIGVDYSFKYFGKNYDQIQSSEESGTAFEREATHRMVHAVSIEYPLKDNLSFLMDVPFVSVYDDRQGQTADIEDFGDPYMGILYQPVKETESMPGVILSTGVSFPMGRSPYEINPQTEFPTGDGVHSLNFGVNLSKKINPTLIYGGWFYSYKLKKDGLFYKNRLTTGETGEFLKEVKPGDETGFNAGAGYVISENISVSLGFRLLYKFPTDYKWRARGNVESSSTSEYEILLGTAWQVTEKRKIFMSLGIGSGNSNEDFSFSLRVPFNFIL
jgi:opacity protein-like surface antigen